MQGNLSGKTQFCAFKEFKIKLKDTNPVRFMQLKFVCTIAMTQTSETIKNPGNTSLLLKEKEIEIEKHIQSHLKKPHISHCRNEEPLNTEKYCALRGLVFNGVWIGLNVEEGMGKKD